MGANESCTLMPLTKIVLDVVIFVRSFLVQRLLERFDCLIRLGMKLRQQICRNLQRVQQFLQIFHVEA